ncbi:hypothetical protein [Bizionia sp.]|uniref:hypothetical protein n=1 Tax=Bizionia sp. TaxID=1954480 RepID=UPI003A92D97D
MNKKILSTLLVLIPRKIQQKSVAKALNYLFPTGFFESKESRTIEFSLTDLKHSWILKMDEYGFHASSRKIKSTDIVIKSELNTILESQDSRNLKNALSSGNIEIVALPSDAVRLKKVLSSIGQNELDEIISHCYRFFKLSPRSRINIRTVTLDDIRIAKDVDFIRDEAIKLEKVDLNEALRLMEIAQCARPNGPFIAKKVKEYRIALDK